MNAKINELMQEIQNREAKIAQRDNTIHDLQAEIERLNQLNQQAGASGSELQSKLAETQRALADAQAKIAQLE